MPERISALKLDGTDRAAVEDIHRAIRALRGKLSPEDNKALLLSATPLAVISAFPTSESVVTIEAAIYDEWYGSGKIQAWLLVEGNPNFDQIAQVERKPEAKKALRRCGDK